MHLARQSARIFCTFVMLVTFSSPPYAFAAGANRPPNDPENKPPSEISTLHLDVNDRETGVDYIEVRTLTVDEENLDQLGQQVAKLTNGQTDIPLIDEMGDGTPSRDSGVTKLRGWFRNKFSQAKFTWSKVTDAYDGLTSHQKTLVVTAAVVGFMGTEKVLEIRYSQAPVHMVWVMSAAFLIASAVGVVNYFSVELKRFYSNHNPIVTKLVDQLAASPNPKKRWWSHMLNRGTFYTKMAAVNTLCYFIFKTALYSFVKSEGGVVDRLHHALELIWNSTFDKSIIVGFGIAATVFGIPTTEFIINHIHKLEADAKGDPHKLAHARYLLTAYLSAAMTLRATSFSSLLVGYTLHNPIVMGGGATVILAMTGSSIWKLWWDKKQAQRSAARSANCEEDLTGIAELGYN